MATTTIYVEEGDQIGRSNPAKDLPEDEEYKVVEKYPVSIFTVSNTYIRKWEPPEEIVLSPITDPDTSLFYCPVPYQDPKILPHCD